MMEKIKEEETNLLHRRMPNNFGDTQSSMKGLWAALRGAQYHKEWGKKE